MLVSVSIRMLYCWVLLLLQRSLRERKSDPRSNPLVLTKSTLVSFGVFALGMSPHQFLLFYWFPIPYDLGSFVICFYVGWY